MHMANCIREVGGETQEARQLERSAERAGEGLAAFIFEEERRRRLVAIERQWLSGPTGVKPRRQRIFVLEARDTFRRRTRCNQNEYRNRIARLPRAIEREVSVFAQRFEFASSDIHSRSYSRGIQRPAAILLAFESLGYGVAPPIYRHQKRAQSA
jgi:hypothetical protein